MDELILRHLAGETTDVEKHRLEKWRASSPANEAWFQETQILWKGLESVTGPRSKSRLPDIDAMVAEAERRRSRDRASRSRRAFLRSPWTAYAVAAAIAGIALFAVSTWRGERPLEGTLATVASSVGPDHVVAMTLSDGSFLRLAQGTTVDFPTAEGRREVTLEGKAFFAVAPASLPFVVRTQAGEVSVHGTRFEARTEGDRLDVVVVEGTVELIGRGGTRDVGQGQVGSVAGDGAPTVKTVDDVWALLDWPDALLAFQQTPLVGIAAQLTARFGVPVVIGDSSVVDRRVTGSFGDESLDDIVSAVCAVTAVRCEHRGAAVVIGVPEG
ncbi:MAG: FecR domain-containing protein [Gemmatimonadota bacterium]|jgi:ferric-dicitrate binding protein FerR (iron transport regulator)